MTEPRSPLAFVTDLAAKAHKLSNHLGGHRAAWLADKAKASAMDGDLAGTMEHGLAANKAAFAHLKRLLDKKIAAFKGGAQL